MIIDKKSIIKITSDNYIVCKTCSIKFHERIRESLIQALFEDNIDHISLSFITHEILWIRYA